MKAIVFNTMDSHLSKIEEAVMLKAGFLFGNEVYTAGTTSYELSLKENMANIPVMRQLSFLVRRHSAGKGSG